MSRPLWSNCLCACPAVISPDAACSVNPWTSGAKPCNASVALNLLASPVSNPLSLAASPVSKPALLWSSAPNLALLSASNLLASNALSVSYLFASNALSVSYLCWANCKPSLPASLLISDPALAISASVVASLKPNLEPPNAPARTASAEFCLCLKSLCLFSCSNAGSTEVWNTSWYCLAISGLKLSYENWLGELKLSPIMLFGSAPVNVPES